MSRIQARRIIAFTITGMFAVALGSVTGPVIILLMFIDPVQADALSDWMFHTVEGFYCLLAH